ncbi:arsenate reductase (glutaredoxin) [Sphingomonas quercus]|uniref:Arsenate reductase n=1 Tax=Sphingomonas quercus TaxID=2842451 RepID=A0ABS6BM79_9SPHN|nr:arsenate reductase (glutaredoxin) [Sphingomonas quercus]
MKARIFHNPRCSKSREALALLEAAPGVEIEIVDYLKTPPSAAELERLYARAGMSPRDGLRKGEDGAKALAGADDAAVLAAMAANPILIERPLVETEKGVALGRPPERIGAIL